MTTFIQFNPQQNQNFQFNPTLDGVPYVAVVTWNIYGMRYYISVYDISRNLISYIPLVGSPDNYDINLMFGYFTSSTLVYRVSSNNFEISP
jgi:hypothetical protein